jgi:hypothetical protein
VLWSAVFLTAPEPWLTPISHHSIADIPPPPSPAQPQGSFSRRTLVPFLPRTACITCVACLVPVRSDCTPSDCSCPCSFFACSPKAVSGTLVQSPPPVVLSPLSSAGCLAVATATTGHCSAGPAATPHHHTAGQHQRQAAPLGLHHTHSQWQCPIIQVLLASLQNFCSSEGARGGQRNRQAAQCVTP